MATDLITVPGGGVLPAPASYVPEVVGRAGTAALFAWDEFFGAQLRNGHTRAAYLRAVRRFLAWCCEQHIELARITPGLVGKYFDEHPGSIPTRKLHLAAIRRFFDVLVTRHAVVLNPALSVRGERYQVVEGKTPEITAEQARAVQQSINVSHVVG